MRALVVGLGRMGTLHRKVLRDLGYDVTTVDPAVEEADYARVADAMIVEVQAFGTHYTRFDVAVVAVPIPELVDVAFQLAGVPKLLVEKPFAPTVKEALMLSAYLASCGSDVGVGYVERFNPQVRELRRQLITAPQVTGARFTRHNARSSSDHELDLLIHDVDLASFLHLWECSPAFDVKSDNGEHVRRIEVDVMRSASEASNGNRRETIMVDLMDHQLSPLHAMWHAFLTTGEDVARPAHAIRALEYARFVTRQVTPA